MYAQNGSYVCITNVESYNDAPHIKLADATIDGKPVKIAVNCSNFTFSFGGSWTRFDVGSPGHTICSYWSR